MASPSTAALTATGLIGGYEVARRTRKRQLGGAVLGAAGLLAFLRWKKEAGLGRAIALTAVYVGAFGASHPLAKKIGARESVAAVTAAASTAALVFGKKKAAK